MLSELALLAHDLAAYPGARAPGRGVVDVTLKVAGLEALDENCPVHRCALDRLVRGLGVRLLGRRQGSMREAAPRGLEREAHELCAAECGSGVRVEGFGAPQLLAEELDHRG